MRFSILLGIVLLPVLFVSANVWDNLFDGEGVPFEVPVNFTAVITPTNISQKIKYNIISSVVFNALAINMTSETEGPEGAPNATATQLKFNFNLGFLWMYSVPKGCVRIYDPDLIFNFYYRLEGLVELALLLTSRDLVDEYKRVAFDPKILSLEIAECVNDVAFYFIDDKTLSRIEADFKNGTQAAFVIDSMGQKHDVSYKEFSPQSDWECKELNQVEFEDTNYLVDSEGNRQTYSEVISDFAKSTSEQLPKTEDREEYIANFEKFHQSFIHC